MSWKFWRGEILKQMTRDSIHRGLMKAGEAILEVSKQQVPLDEGTLSHTGIVVPNKANDMEVVISYGGGPNTGFPRVPYAVKWHETPANFQHGRKHNYLRDPIKTHGRKFVEKELKNEARKVW